MLKPGRREEAFAAMRERQLLKRAGARKGVPATNEKLREALSNEIRRAEFWKTRAELLARQVEAVRKFNVARVSRGLVGNLLDDLAVGEMRSADAPSERLRPHLTSNLHFCARTRGWRIATARLGSRIVVLRL